MLFPPLSQPLLQMSIFSTLPAYWDALKKPVRVKTAGNSECGGGERERKAMLGTNVNAYSHCLLLVGTGHQRPIPYQ